MDNPREVARLLSVLLVFLYQRSQYNVMLRQFFALQRLRIRRRRRQFLCAAEIAIRYRLVLFEHSPPLFFDLGEGFLRLHASLVTNPAIYSVNRVPHGFLSSVALRIAQALPVFLVSLDEGLDLDYFPALSTGIL